MSRPFAAPLNAVDRIDADGDNAIVATKQIVATDPYLGGHYPHFTIYPGVFTIETVYQAARDTVERRAGAGSRAELSAMSSVRFSAPLLPGDVLTANCAFTESADSPDTVTVKAKCRRSDGQTAAQMKFELTVHREHADA